METKKNGPRIVENSYGVWSAQSALCLTLASEFY